MPLDNINTIQISDRDVTDLDRTNSKDNLYNSKYDDIVNKHKESNPMSQPSTKYVINKPKYVLKNPYENKQQELIYDSSSMLRDAIDEAIERNQRIKENDDRILERIRNSQYNKTKTNQIKDANKPKYVLKNPYENKQQELIYDNNILTNTINTAINKE